MADLRPFHWWHYACFIGILCVSLSACFIVSVLQGKGMAVLHAFHWHYVCFICILRVSSSACFIVSVLQGGEWLFCVSFIGIMRVSLTLCVFHRLRVSSSACCKAGNGCSACVSLA